MADSVTAPPDSQIPWALTEVTNSLPVPHGKVRTESRFYDSDDTLLEVRDGFTHYIPANTTWRNYIRYYTETPDRVDRVETRIADAQPEVTAQRIQNISVVSADLQAEPESGVDFAVEVDPGSGDYSRITILGLFYDAEGRFRGTIRGIESNPANTVAVSGRRIGIRTPPNLDDEQVESYDVVAYAGVV